MLSSRLPDETRRDEGDGQECSTPTARVVCALTSFDRAFDDLCSVRDGVNSLLGLGRDACELRSCKGGVDSAAADVDQLLRRSFTQVLRTAALLWGDSRSSGGHAVTMRGVGVVVVASQEAFRSSVRTSLRRRLCPVLLSFRCPGAAESSNVW